MKHTHTLMWKEINETPAVFNQFIKNNENTIAEIVKAVKAKNINHVYAVARGTSDHALLYFKYALEIKCGIPVTLGACSVVTLYGGKLNLKNSLVIGCSQSGRAADVLEIVRLGKSQKALTLSVTNNPESPLGKEADFHIFCSAGEEKSVAATKTFSAQLFALLYLASAIAGDGDIDELKSLADKVSANMGEIDKASDICAKNYSSIKDGFILSRGITYAISLEAALKLQETSYIAIKGYATSDFFHGPMAMVSSGMPVFVFAAKYNFADKTLSQNHFEDQCKGIDKMLELGANVLVVTDDSNLSTKYDGKVKSALIPNSKNEYFAMFMFAIFAQMSACKISCAIGNNPDSPRALNKVTVTK